MSSGILLGGIWARVKLEFGYPAGRIWHHNGGWHFGIRHSTFDIHLILHPRISFWWPQIREYQFIYWIRVLRSPINIYNCTAVLIVLPQVLQLYYLLHLLETSEYYSRTILSTTAGIILLPGAIFYTCWITSAGTGLKSSNNDEPFLLNRQDEPCLNWIH